MKVIQPDAMDRGVTTLRRMRQIAESAGAPVRAVATSAVREAQNAVQFITRAADEAGVEIEVISGLEEARLIHLGVLQAVPAFDRRLILVDVGGGSTEVLLGERGNTLAARSFKLGAVRLTDRFFPGGRIDGQALAECRAYVRSVLASFEREVAATGFEVAIVSSGTAESLARMVHAAESTDTLRTYNCFEFDHVDLAAIVEQITSERTPRARLGIPGLDSERADIIVAGAVLLDCICTAFGITRLMFSDYALREGVLLDTIERHRGGTLHHLRDVSRDSVRHLAQRCDDDLVHSGHVARLAMQLFDATAGIHGLDAPCREYLEASALLANVGLVISHSKHHLHSYYVIRNSDDLTGFTDNEIEIIALIARYHRKSAPKPSHSTFVSLRPDAQRVVRVLSGLLRVAIGLDRSHDQRVRSVRARQEGTKLVVEVSPRRRADISLELYSARERAGLLAEVTGLDIELVAAV